MNETENGIPYEPLNSIKDADNVSVDEDIGDDFYDNLEGMTNNKCDNYSLQMLNAGFVHSEWFISKHEIKFSSFKIL